MDTWREREKKERMRESERDGIWIKSLKYLNFLKVFLVGH